MSIYAFGVQHITWWIPSSKIETIFTIVKNLDQINSKENVQIVYLFSVNLLNCILQLTFEMFPFLLSLKVSDKCYNAMFSIQMMVTKHSSSETLMTTNL